MLLTRLFLFVLFFLESCSFGNYVVNGPLDNKVFLEISALPTETLIRVNSSGGNPDIAESIYEVISDRNHPILVENICLSSCVEYLLRSSSDVTFENEPIIGVHQNPSMFRFILNDVEELSNYKLCKFEGNLKFYSTMYSKAKVSASEEDYINKVLENLGLNGVRYRDGKGCIEVGVSFDVDFWLPNSTDIKTFIISDFSGTVCADNFDKCKRKVDRFWPSGAIIMIDDQIHIAK